MERFFANAYRGDPGVPHADRERFGNIWIGSFAFAAISWFNPYFWQLSRQINTTGRKRWRRGSHISSCGTST
ncbi:hypothetical protein AQUCO_00200877v1 [Aquilegia coerulea]|uniref:Uncharacterized protein n=1 Tax=Aquilegia coerulea TaxID=218851 RepID=A0A2G5F555_AQUCA|nr:hypothetical protein AQUCO_00200877v1 [Aquilegia coerulea]